MGDVPTPDEVRAALEDLDSDSRFWFQSAQLVGSAGQVAQSLLLGSFEIGIVGVELGVLEKYAQVQLFVAKSLNDGRTEMEKLSLALRDARDQIDDTDREAGAGIGGVLGEALGSVSKNPPGR
ncbi:hypothetical protein [Actinoplanes flavus]|uniref:Excreted virulence factor EspC, type VII ESX diderm n=1 Tax=Actinoplanes flavus TaxID=2820290 RepID=A0ABS3UDT5_9ACTN|nr:hypothetical protein [Actinoplanes flavus]MBO3736944.1 hypothetical protein [Actinoplanes flavus]